MAAGSFHLAASDLGDSYDRGFINENGQFIAVPEGQSHEDFCKNTLKMRVMRAFDLGWVVVGEDPEKSAYSFTGTINQQQQDMINIIKHARNVNLSLKDITPPGTQHLVLPEHVGELTPSD